jgi:uncharacterized 2Fe-2S/4Fe-4S cluster protein (DUF4445 family)
MKMTFQVDFEPVGRRIKVGDDESLLAAAQKGGVALAAVCGGVGVCGACKVRLVNGVLTPPRTVEQQLFSPEEISKGWRLACQAMPRSDLKIEIPPESMTTTQRLQLEGMMGEIPLDPVVEAVDLEIPVPSLMDLRADADRLVGALVKAGFPELKFSLPVLTQFSRRMREQHWSGRILIRGREEIIGVLETSSVYYGLAVDIGTTKMAAFLVDLTTGRTVAKQGVMNPQIAFGEDVVSRIAYANVDEGHRLALQERLVDALNELLEALCLQVGVTVDRVADLVVVGNTAMHHLFAGLGVRQLGQAPYVAAASSAIQFPAREIGLKTAPGAAVYLPPNIAGYVGADHVAMLLASRARQQPGVTVALDIGTNTEISLAKEDRLVSCSCASGPAFEGAHIHAGMRAIPGAIERAQFYEDAWHLSTIDDEPSVGICGSGILDIVAELLRTGQIDHTGRFSDRAHDYRDLEKGGAIRLVPETLAGTDQDILVLRGDIREIQLAKAAIRAGIDALLRETNTQPEEIDHFIIAGAFGTYLHLESAVRIGMFPRLPREHYHQIGNAAGAGAQMMLISRSCRENAKEILEKMSYIELTTDAGFMDAFVDAITFEPLQED